MEWSGRWKSCVEVPLSTTEHSRGKDKLIYLHLPNHGAETEAAYKQTSNTEFLDPCFF